MSTKAWKKAAQGFVVVALIVIVLLIAVLGILLYTDPGRALLLDNVNRLASSDGLRVRLHGLSGRMPWKIRLKSLTLADEQGIWLAGENLSVDWDFLPALAGRLRFSAIVLERVVLHRFPASKDDREDRPFQMPTLVFPDLHIKTLRLPQLVIRQKDAENLLYAAQGECRLNRTTADVRLNVNRPGWAEDGLKAQVRLSGDPLALDVSLDLRESRSGPLGTLMGAPQGSDLRANIHGRGLLSDWQGELSAGVDGWGALKTVIRARGKGLPVLSARGEVSPGPAIWPVMAARLVGRQIGFFLEARMTEDRRVLIRQLNLENDRVGLRVNGDFDPQGPDMNGQAVLEVKQTEPLAELFQLRVKPGQTISLLFNGSPAAPAVVCRADLEGIAWDQLAADRVSLNLSASLSAPSGETAPDLSAGGTITVKGLAAPGNVRLDRAVLTLDALVQGWKKVFVRQLALEAGALTADVTGGVDLEKKETRVELKADIVALEQMPILKDQGLSGRGGLRAVVRGKFDEPDLALDLSGRFMDLKGLPEPAPKIVGSALDLSARARLHGHTLDVDAFQVRGAAGLTAQGTMDLEKKDFLLNWEVDAASLPAVAKDYGVAVVGPVQMKGALSGPWTAFRATAKVRAASLEWAGRRFSNPALDLDLQGLPTAVSGTLALKSQFEKRPANAFIALGMAGEAIDLKEIKVSVAGADLKGRLKVGAKSKLVDGALSLSSKDLAALSGLAGVGLKGGLDLDVQLASRAGKQSVGVKGRASGLDLASFSAKTVNLEVDTRDLKSASGRARLQLDAARAGQVAIPRLTFSFSGGLEKGSFQLDTSADWQGKVDLSAKGTVRRGKGLLALGLQEAGGTWRKTPYRLLKPLAVRLADREKSLDDLHLKIGSGTVSGRAKMTAKTVAAGVSIQQLSLALLDGLIPVAVQGQVNGTLSVQGPLAKPNLKAEINLKDLKPDLPTIKWPRPVDAGLNLALAGNRLNATLNVSGLGPQPVRAELAMPVNVSLDPFVLKAPESGKLDGKLQAALDLGLLPPALAWDDQALAGGITLDARLAGIVSAPRLSGRAVLSKAKYENVRFGLILDAMSGVIEATGSEVVLQRLEATDGEKGRLKASGRFSLDGGQANPYRLKLSLDSASLVRTDLVHTQATGAIVLEGNLKKARLSGEVDLRQIEVALPRQSPPGLVDLDIKEINVPPNLAPKKKKEARSDPFPLELSLAVSIPGRAFIRGRGLESEWKGNLKVTGTAAEPGVRGRMDLVRGRFDFLGKRFKLTQGTVVLDGAVPLSPALDVEGEVSAKDITAEIRLSGPVADPDITLDSTPSLPQDEILARVLFGKSLDSISPVQALSLARMAAEMAGGSTGPDVMGMARELLHVDRLSISQSDSGAPTLGVGKYVDDRIYVEARKGAEPGDDTVSVEIELSPLLSLESEAGAKGSGSVMLNLKLDY